MCLDEEKIDENEAAVDINGKRTGWPNTRNALQAELQRNLKNGNKTDGVGKV